MCMHYLIKVVQINLTLIVKLIKINCKINCKNKNITSREKAHEALYGLVTSDQSTLTSLPPRPSLSAPGDHMGTSEPFHTSLQLKPPGKVFPHLWSLCTPRAFLVRPSFLSRFICPPSPPPNRPHPSLPSPPHSQLKATA